MSFDDALAFVLKREGGRVDDPKDRGGRTNRGVTQRVYDRYREQHDLPPADVWDILPAEVKAIYRAGYWDAVKGDTLSESSPEIALATFEDGHTLAEIRTVGGWAGDIEEGDYRPGVNGVKYPNNHMRFSREELQSMIDLLDGKPVPGFFEGDQ